MQLLRLTFARNVPTILVTPHSGYLMPIFRLEQNSSGQLLPLVVTLTDSTAPESTDVLCETPAQHGCTNMRGGHEQLRAACRCYGSDTKQAYDEASPIHQIL
jgi:hypothetical protein